MYRKQRKLQGEEVNKKTLEKARNLLDKVARGN